MYPMGCLAFGSKSRSYHEKCSGKFHLTQLKMCEWNSLPCNVVLVAIYAVIGRAANYVSNGIPCLWAGSGGFFTEVLS